jgi:Zn ribbon nucleic-acid-binding protein
VDHIIPQAEGGETTQDNLCCACGLCNGHKQKRTHARDPQTRRRVRLFHPRRQKWARHFRWSEDGTQIIGLTACGRATVEALQMNHPDMVRARRNWVAAGWHPPKD